MAIAHNPCFTQPRTRDRTPPSWQVPLYKKFAAGMTTGAVGSALANPTDLVKIRFQREAGRIGADGLYASGLHKGKAPAYRNTFVAFAEA